MPMSYISVVCEWTICYLVCPIDNQLPVPSPVADTCVELPVNWVLSDDGCVDRLVQDVHMFHHSITSGT